MTVKEYQNYCKNKLEIIYQDVKIEWNPFGRRSDQYSPRPDIAVGPFATNSRLERDYDKLIIEPRSKKFIESLIKANNQNITKIGGRGESVFSDISYFNYNARCFICLEIENKVSRKHLIGGLVNASALGRIAILVAWTPSKLKAFIKLKNYLKFLSSVEKNSFKTDNILILDKDQFKELVDAAAIRPNNDVIDT
jgi:hypothetical protein